MILQTLAAKVAHGSALRNSDGVHEGRTTFGEGNKGHSDAKRWKQIQADRNRLSLKNAYSASDVVPAHIAVVPSLASDLLLIQQRGPGPHGCGLEPLKCSPAPRTIPQSSANPSYPVALNTPLPLRELGGFCSVLQVCFLNIGLLDFTVSPAFAHPKDRYLVPPIPGVPM